MLKQEDFDVLVLGECKFTSPLKAKKAFDFVADGTRVLYETELEVGADALGALTCEKAGPRERLFFNPAQTSAAIVTCGGLSPGLNNVIRSVYLELTYNYGVKRLLGIRNGYAGLNPAYGLEPVTLTFEHVDVINNLGGTVLGTSRGPQNPAVIVDFLERMRIDILFCLGGDGTLRGAHAIFTEVRNRGLSKSIVGIPKTIDNDIPFVWMTFGYATALEKAQEALRGAHVEARAAPNGIALVKLMGRDAGFIAAGAALASQEANFVLVPEASFPLDGEDGFLAAVQRRIQARKHALIVVAEGAGQHLMPHDETRRDASGNVRYGDIGVFLREKILEHFAQRQIPVNLKYIDPSYLIRSVPANTFDRILSDQMGRHAVHAAMAGKTDVLIGSWSNKMIHVPIGTAVASKKQLDLSGDLWDSVLANTGQPRW